MKNLKALKVIPSKTGNVAVNSTFNYKNSRVLSSMARAGQPPPAPIKNISKVTNPVMDSKRIADLNPEKSNKNIFSKLGPSAIPSIKKAMDTLAATPQFKEAVKTAVNSAGTGGFTIGGPTGMAPIIPDGVIFTGSTSRFSPDGAIPQSAPIPLPPVLDAPGIRTFSLLDESDKDIFKPGSFLDAKSNLVDEQSVGILMKKNEKPRILAIISENIQGGYPTANTIVIKKPPVNVTITNVVILRKSLFRERLFSKIGEFDIDNLNTSADLITFVESLGFSSNSVISVRDTTIKPNATYVYKVQITWVYNGKEPKTFVDVIRDNPDALDSFRPSYESLFMSGVI